MERKVKLMIFTKNCFVLKQMQMGKHNYENQKFEILNELRVSPMEVKVKNLCVFAHYKLL